jgi:GNAT superfamily N-acetyltransferase
MVEKNFSLIVVENSKHVKQFLDLPSAVHENEKYWIRPLDDEIEKVFDRSKNKLFKTGDAIRWLLVDNNKKVVGRIAAFYDKRSAAKNDQPTGGVGFFECINDRQAAHSLFDAGKEWLRGKGMEAMDGPVNFGDRNNFWGCLIDGFDKEPVFNMPYNPEYYKELFESYGFQNYFNQYTYHIDTKGGVRSPVLREKGKRLLKNKDYTFRTIKGMSDDEIADAYVTIYNKAWASFPGVPKVRRQHAKAILNAIKPILDHRTFIYGFYKDEPVVFYIMVPDLNQMIYDFNGKMNLFNKLKLFYRLKVAKKSTRLIGLIFGVVPEHQGKGVETAILLRFEREIRDEGFPYTDLEMNWIGDFNPVMMKFVQQIGGKIHKTHVTYRYLFDRNKEFKRARKSI